MSFDVDISRGGQSIIVSSNRDLTHNQSLMSAIDVLSAALDASVAIGSLIIFFWCVNFRLKVNCR